MPFSTVSVETLQATVDYGVGGTVQNTVLRRPFSFSSKRRLWSLTKDITPDTYNKVVPTAMASGSPGVYYPVITMAVNPQTIAWNQPKRIARRDTMGGVAFFHFTNKVGQDNDIVQMEFKGVTGNINFGNRPTPAPKDPHDPEYNANYTKLLIWHNLYNLTREPILFDDPDHPGQKIENEFYIMYRTPLIPTPIILKGIFSKVLQFDESAERPNMVPYSFTFWVQDTTPPLDHLVYETMGLQVGEVSP